MKTIKALAAVKKAIKADVRKACRKVNNVLLDYFAPYGVVCSSGTKKLCWTMADAHDWLKYCGDRAYIFETYDHLILASRKQ